MRGINDYRIWWDTPNPTPSHPFTPDVVAWAEEEVKPENKYHDPRVIRAHERIIIKAARQIIAAVGRG